MSSVCSAVQTIKSGNGSQTQFSFDFPYVFKSEIHVYFWNVTTKEYSEVLTTDSTYPWQVSNTNPTIVEFTGTAPPAPPSSDTTANVKIRRITNIDDIRALFNPGSAIRSNDLNSNFEQLRFAIQEALCPDITEAEVVTYLQKYYWNNFEDTVYSTDTWTSSDTKIATTAALDARFQDEAAETITSSESWPNDDNTIATTAKIDDVIDAAITNDIGADSTGITVTDDGDGTITLGIAANSVDLDRIKSADIVSTSAYSSTWTNVDDKVATVGAIAKRLDAIVSTSQPTNAQVGKFWYNPSEGINALYMWNGTEWKVLTSGTPYIPAGTTIVRYVDAVNGSDAAGVSGFLPQSPLRSIKRAITLINASSSGDGTLVVVEPGVYQEALPLRIEKNNVSIVGKSLRSCFIHPTVATENNNMWEVDSGTYISGFTMLGLKVPTSDQGSRNNSIDNDSTYGLPSNQPFAVSFRSGNPVILKSPYIQNCTHFSDAHFDNANFDPNTFPSTDSQTYSAVAGDETSAPCGGGLLVDGSVPAQSSPIRSMVVDAFTQITLDGPGILVTNNGYAQLVSFFGTFCHYHAKAKNGGQINLSNCVTDFGRYGLIAEGKSPTAIATATASAANSGATTVTIGAISSASGFHGTVSRPLDHMMMTIDGTDYGVVSSTANGSGWDVTITPALASNISNTSVSFALRSYISTGGHTFEYVGVGTDYSDHPDNGGVAVEANQVKELSGGKVWQSSTDHIGKFKAGNVLTVDQIAETLSVNGNITVTGTNAINGNITVTGTVDGRDVATDGTKLDGIEAGATADQTAAEIRTLVESATDSNVFTDADHTKLNGIAAGATVYANSNVDAHLNRSTASSGEILSWNGSDYDWIAAAAGYSDSNVDSHLNRSTAATGEVLSWNGSDYDWVAASSGATNINGLSDALTSSPNNMGFGQYALANLSTGGNNLAIGSTSLNAVTTGNKNVGVGASGPLALTTTGNENVAVGYGASYYNTTGSYNVAVGTEALNQNTRDGLTAVGYQAGYNNTTGRFSVYVGYKAGDAITSGGYNTVVGYDALGGNVSGGQNVAIGHQSLLVNTSWSNTSVGSSSMSNSTTGDENTACGALSLGQLTTGIDNTAVGRTSGYNLTTGSNNTCIGWGAYASSATVSNEITLGNSSVNSFRIPGIDYTIDSYGQVKAEGFRTTTNAVTSGSIDLRQGNYFIASVAGAVTFSFNNPPTTGTVCSFTIELTYISGTVTWPGSSTLKWNGGTAPTLTAGKTHLLVFVTDDGGTRYRGAALLDYDN